MVFSELESCTLCEHSCGVNRLAGEIGVCRTTLPAVASATLHPAPPSSYTVFLAGCNFKCLNCQNWSISCFPDTDSGIRGFIEPVLRDTYTNPAALLAAGYAARAGCATHPRDCRQCQVSCGMRTFVPAELQTWHSFGLLLP